MSRQLEARPCNVLGKDLLYFFALKPAYGLKEGDQKSHQLNRFPFAFVVRAEAVTPYHVYPFDTGAARGGLFDAAADSYIPLDDYELMPSHAAVMGQIGWAFGSLEAYYECELRTDIMKGVPPYETVTSGFVDIARMPASGRNQPDARASAIEVACAHHVPLKDNVLLAVIPRQYLEGEDGDDPNDDLITMLKRENIPYRLYDWQSNLTPNSFRDEIARIVKEFHREPPALW